MSFSTIASIFRLLYRFQYHCLERNRVRVGVSEISLRVVKFWMLSTRPTLINPMRSITYRHIFHPSKPHDDQSRFLRYGYVCHCRERRRRQVSPLFVHAHAGQWQTRTSPLELVQPLHSGLNACGYAPKTLICKSRQCVCRLPKGGGLVDVHPEGQQEPSMLYISPASR